MEDRSACAPRGTLLEVVHALMEEVEALRLRVDLLEAPGTIRARGLELLDEEGQRRIRLGYHGEEGLVGMECLRSDGSLSAFFGELAGEGSLMFTGGAFDAIVVELSANEEGAHLAVVDPSDPAGGRSVDALDQARRQVMSLP